MADHIALLKAIEQDTKEWSEGKRVEAISKKLAWILLVVLAAFFVTTMLNSQMRSYSVFSLPPASILVMFLIHELNMGSTHSDQFFRRNVEHSETRGSRK